MPLHKLALREGGQREHSLWGDIYLLGLCFGFYLVSNDGFAFQNFFKMYQ